jgi:hypothetical protein
MVLEPFGTVKSVYNYSQTLRGIPGKRKANKSTGYDYETISTEVAAHMDAWENS